MNASPAADLDAARLSRDDEVILDESPDAAGAAGRPLHDDGDAQPSVVRLRPTDTSSVSGRERSGNRR